MNIFAHTDHAVETVNNEGLLDSLTHQPTWVSLLIIAFVLFGVYALLEKLKVKSFNRVLALVPLLILFAIIYLQHNPLITTVLLSIGFVTTFVIAFTLMTGKGENKKPETEKLKDDKQA